jgi:hypothetical protein
MIEQAYASPSGGVPIKSPQYKDNRGLIMNYIPLPKCGIVVEVRTDNLPIRKPEISEVLKGVYNNGYEGDEWIADQVPKSQYRVIRLILSLYSNDSKKLVVDISGDTKEELEKAINIIKTEFEKRKEWGLRYKSFLEGLDSKVRMNEYLLKREWEKFDKGQ